MAAKKDISLDILAKVIRLNPLQLALTGGGINLTIGAVYPKWILKGGERMYHKSMKVYRESIEKAFLSYHL